MLYIKKIVKTAYIMLTLMSILGSLYFLTTLTSAKEREVAKNSKPTFEKSNKSVSPLQSFGIELLQNGEKAMQLVARVI